MAKATATQTGRKYIDCSEYPSDNNCTLRISGTEDEVMTAATQHAKASHGHEDTPEFREELRGMLKDE
jgi:predicted small metal-binding protein